MSLNEFINDLAKLGVQLQADGDQLRVRAKQGVLTADLKKQIGERKQELLGLLQARSNTLMDSELPQIVADPKNRFNPFPLTDIQHAYWVGRSDVMALGNIGVHAYIEIEQEGLDVNRLSDVFNILLARHDMLRMVIHADGEQQVLESVPEYHIQLTEYNEDEAAAEAHMEQTRKTMSHRVFDTQQWPLFDIRATAYKQGRVRLHISLDILMADLWSLFRLFSEWKSLYEQADKKLPDLTVSFRDYILAERALEQTPFYQSARSYWLNRLDTIAPGPELPLAKQLTSINKPEFTRRHYELNKEAWGKLRKIAAGYEITPSGLLLSAFAEVLTLWSKNPKFTLNLTLFNRLPLHSQVNELVGDFTTTILLAIDSAEENNFEKRAKRIQKQLYADLDNRVFNGVRVLRELSQRQSGQPNAAMPVVFSSALGLDSVDGGSSVDTRLGGQLGDVVYTITQTPQVWLDHQVFEHDGALSFNWDVIEELFPQGLLDDMFNSYCDLLERLVSESETWAAKDTLSLPKAQQQQRESYNQTATQYDRKLLNQLVMQRAAQSPNAEAVVDNNRRMSYQALASESNQLARQLQTLGVSANTLIAIVLEKGWEQVVATLGILNAGAAYVPIDPELPEARREYLLKHGDISVVVTRSDLMESLAWPANITCVCIDDKQLATLSDEVLECTQKDNDLAYIIYTSGSTGVPKGVAVEHKAAVNTILDINERYQVNSNDRVLAVSSLSFDLSVYDIFGVLAAGGTIVFPGHDQDKDSACWGQLIASENITLWNSVPALFQLLVEYFYGIGGVENSTLRLAMLSGDWIPLDLPARAKNIWPELDLNSLGGATEAAIWSISYPIHKVNENWQSIPYGKPLTNQKFYVLDNNLQDCPEWVTGQLFIGGAGLARGYWKDEEKTQASFIIHPVSGERLYRTGDLGRFLADGNIEFLGREDLQVKVNGYRIELGEIENVINTHSNIKDCVVIASGEKQSNKKLIAYMVSANAGIVDGFDEKEIEQYLKEQLPSYMVPRQYVRLNEIPLTSNGKVDRNNLPEPTKIKQSKPSDTKPTTLNEKQLAALFENVLHVEDINLQDNFFELGGDSLLATKLVALINKKFKVELHLRDLFNAPSISELVPKINVSQSVATAVALKPVSELTEYEEEGEL